MTTKTKALTIATGLWGLVIGVAIVTGSIGGRLAANADELHEGREEAPTKTELTCVASIQRMQRETTEAAQAFMADGKHRLVLEGRAKAEDQVSFDERKNVWVVVTPKPDPRATKDADTAPVRSDGTGAASPTSGPKK